MGKYIKFDSHLAKVFTPDGEVWHSQEVKYIEDDKKIESLLANANFKEVEDLKGTPKSSKRKEVINKDLEALLDKDESQIKVHDNQ